MARKEPKNPCDIVRTSGASTLTYIARVAKRPITTTFGILHKCIDIKQLRLSKFAIYYATLDKVNLRDPVIRQMVQYLHEYVSGNTDPMRNIVFRALVYAYSPYAEPRDIASLGSNMGQILIELLKRVASLSPREYVRMYGTTSAHFFKVLYNMDVGADINIGPVGFILGDKLNTSDPIIATTKALIERAIRTGITRDEAVRMLSQHVDDPEEYIDALFNKIAVKRGNRYIVHSSNADSVMMALFTRSQSVSTNTSMPVSMRIEGNKLIIEIDLSRVPVY